MSKQKPAGKRNCIVCSAPFEIRGAAQRKTCGEQCRKIHYSNNWRKANSGPIDTESADVARRNMFLLMPRRAQS